MAQDNVFFSKARNYAVHLIITEMRKGKPFQVARKRCVFDVNGKNGKYIALPADQTELGVDEAELLRKHRDFGVMYWDSKGWAERAKTKLNPVELVAVNAELNEYKTELKSAESKIAELQARLESQEKKSTPDSEDKPKPKGRPKKTE